MGGVGGWVAVVVVLTAWPGWVLCWCAAPLMVGHTVLVRAPPHGAACCVGMWPPPWWGVLRWFVVPLLVGRAVLVRAPVMVGPAVSACAPPPWWGVLCRRVPPPLGGACCVGFKPPSWWGVLRCCVAPLSVGRVASVPACRGRGVWFGVSSSVRWVVVTVVLLAWPGLVCAPSPVGACRVCVWCPLGGKCCVGVFGFRFVVL